MSNWLTNRINSLKITLCKYKITRNIYIHASTDMKDSIKEIKRNTKSLNGSLSQKQVCDALWLGTLQNMPKSLNEARKAIRKHPLQSNSYEIYNAKVHRIYLLDHKYVFWTRLLTLLHLMNPNYNLKYMDSHIIISKVNQQLWHQTQIKILTNYLNDHR